MRNVILKSTLLIGLVIIILFINSCRVNQVRIKSPDFDNSALIVMHMQNDAVKEGGYFDFLPLGDIQSTIPHMQKIIAAARDQDRPVIFSCVSVEEDYSDALWPFWISPDIEEKGLFVNNTWGSQIIDELTPTSGDIIIEDKGYNSFFNGKLDRILRKNKVNTLIIVGVNTNVCVFCTAAGAVENGYQVVTVEDATASFYAEAHESAIETMSTTLATIYSTEYVLLKLKY